MKKILLGLVTMALMIGVVGCSQKETNEENQTNTQQESVQKTDNSNVMIAYFSKTGNTEEIAKEIQTLTNGTLVEIEPVEAYPDSYQETVDIAQNELEENARPKIKDLSLNMDDYDTIFVGYPIWWHDAPMVIYTFLENYDLSNKTIVPFCTSGGSDIQESMPGIQKATKGAKLLDGLTANNVDDVEPWLVEIGMK